VTDYPHHGPVSPDCPVECLLTALSLNAFNPLTRVYNQPFDPPRTVGDVVGLYARGELSRIYGLGPRRISEIEASLVFSGFITANHMDAQEGADAEARND
jgi:hypothetical protein